MWETNKEWENLEWPLGGSWNYGRI
jgi:hypothetical protein